ncbi:MAG: acyltransferase domain-containing protein [Myxococcales bacterium]|nr:acyltransferase domain-containing protein [Myxococcales bacterium]
MLADPTEAEAEAELSPTQRALLAIRRLKAELAAAETARHAPVAIVGMSCRLPGAPSIDALWSLLTEGREGTGPVPRDRWDADALYHPDPTRFGRLTSRRGGFLDGLDRFDPHFFGISSREAPQVDPRQRLVLELTWEALEDAGIPPATLAGSNTATLISVLRADYEVVSRDQDRQIETSTGTGMASTIISNRLAYVFDLRGPSMTIDTACSGSLVGMHLACRDLRAGTADLALVGGVAINLLPWGELFFSRLDALASDGRCKTFDDRADGIVRSEGAAMIVLRRLDDALAAGDRIYAVIRGSAVNQDGRSNGMMAPNGHAQRAVLAAAYADARVEPATVQYVEAHGTGTRLGDPIEVEALDAVLAPGRAPGDTCRLGSIKTNIGHTEPVAGVAGVIKTALCLHHRELVPTLHFTTPNRKIPFDRIPFAVQTERGPWPRPDAPLRAGVSGFGFGGTNAHVVLEAAPATEPPAEPPAADSPADPWTVLPISARAPAALRALVAAWRDRIAALAPDDIAALHPLVRGAATARDRLRDRAAFAARTPAELLAALDTWLAAPPAPPPPVEGPLVFVFSGQGASWFGMGRDLYTREPVFRAAFDAAEAALVELGAAPLRPALFAPEPDAAPDALAAQRGTFAVQYALDALWRARGLTPDVVVGHSLGEVAAACAAGALTLGDAAAVVYHRSRLMAATEGAGATAVVGLDPAAAEARMAGRGGDLAVAGNNRPTSTTVSGTPEAIDALIAELCAEGTFARRIPGVRTAFHGPQMAPVQAALTAALAHLRPRPAAIPILSTVDAGPIAGEALDAAYWGRNVREPFRFAAVVTQLCARGAPVFIELAPHRLLGPAIHQTAGADRALVIPSMHRDTPGGATMAEALARAFVCGLDVPPAAFAPPGPRALDLPRYPWQRARYWLDQIPVHDPPTVPWMQGARLDAGPHPLLGNGLAIVGDGRRVWRNALSAGDPAWVGDHRALGRVIFPGAGFAEIAAAAGEAPGAPVTVTALRFVEALALSSGRRALQIQLTPGPTGRAVQIYSRAEPGAPWQLHADARLDAPAPPPASADLEALRAACPEAITPAAHYDRMTALGLDYGPAFRTVRALHRGPGHVLGRVAVDALAGIDRHHLHPALLDGCFQLAVHLGDDTTSRLPAGVDRIAFTGRRTAAVWCHLTPAPSADPALLRVDLRLYDDDGAPVAAIDGLTLRALDAGPASERPAAELMHTLDWIPEPAPPPAPAPLGRWLIVAEPALAAALAAGLRARDAAAVVTAPPSALDDPEALAAALRDVTAGPDWRGVVFSPAPAPAPYPAAAAAARHLVALLRAISRQDATGAPPRLWILTRGLPLADAPPTPDLGLGAAAAWGIARVAALELGPLWGGVIDAPAPPEAAAAALLAELGAPAPVQAMHRPGARLVPRLRRAPTPAEPAITPRGATLITGGLAGVGLAIARALVDRGARRLLLAGRPPRAPPARGRAGGPRPPRGGAGAARGGAAGGGVGEELGDEGAPVAGAAAAVDGFGEASPPSSTSKPAAPPSTPSPSTSPTPPRSPPRSPTTTPSATPPSAPSSTPPASSATPCSCASPTATSTPCSAPSSPARCTSPPASKTAPSTASCSSPPSPPSSAASARPPTPPPTPPSTPSPTRSAPAASPPPPSAGAPGARPACSAASTPARPAPSPAP